MFSGWISYILFIGALLLVSPGEASQKNVLEKKIYDDMVSLCRMDDSILTAGLRFRESMLSSYDQFNSIVYSFDTIALKTMIRDGGASPTMATILNSDALFEAMRDCYPESIEKRDQFVLSLIVADTAGRGVGSIQGVVTLIVGGKVFREVVNGSYKLMKISKLGEKLNPRYETLHKSIIGFFIVGGITAPTVLELSDKVSQKNTHDNAALAKFSQLIAEAHAGILSLEEDMQKSFGMDRCYQLKTQQTLADLILNFEPRMLALGEMSEETKQSMDFARRVTSATCN